MSGEGDRESCDVAMFTIMDSMGEDVLCSDEARIKAVVVELRFSVSGWLGPLHDPQRYRRIIWRAAVRDFLWQQTSRCLPCSSTSLITTSLPPPSPSKNIYP